MKKTLDKTANAVQLTRSEMKKVLGGVDYEQYKRCNTGCAAEAEAVPSNPAVPPGTAEITYAACMSSCLMTV